MHLFVWLPLRVPETWRQYSRGRQDESRPYRYP